LPKAKAKSISGRAKAIILKNHTEHHIAIISRKDSRKTHDTSTSTVAALREAATTTDYESLFFEDLLFAFDGQKLSITDSSGQGICRFDGFFLMGWFKTKTLDDIALAVTAYATKNNIPYLNTEAGRNRSNAKVSQCVMAVLNDVQTTPFVFAIDRERFLQGIDDANLGYPLIIKSIRGSRGNDNYLVHNRQELHTIVTKSPDVLFMAQTFVPNDGDYRLLVMNGEVGMALHRKAVSDSHLNNTSKGATAKIVPVDELPVAMKQQSVTIAKVLHREITGIDMIVHKGTGEHYFLEANNMPQLSTGSKVPEKIALLDQTLSNWVTEHHARTDAKHTA